MRPFQSLGQFNKHQVGQPLDSAATSSSGFKHSLLRLPLESYSFGCALKENSDSTLPVAWVDFQRIPKQRTHMLRFFNGSEDHSSTYSWRLDRDFDELQVSVVKRLPVVIRTKHCPPQYTNDSVIKSAADSHVIIQLKTTKSFKFTGMNKETCVAGVYVRSVVHRITAEVLIP